MKIIVGVLSVYLVAVIGLCGYLGIQCNNKDKQLTEMQYNLDNTVTVYERAINSYDALNNSLIESNNKMVVELVDIANNK